MKRVGSNMPGEHPLRESYDRGSAGDSDRTLDAGHHGLDGFAICRRRQSCRHAVGSVCGLGDGARGVRDCPSSHRMNVMATYGTESMRALQ
jgi:hypothetical protein